MEIKRNIFEIFEFSRILFNDYYNGHSGLYTDDELEDIKGIVSNIEKYLENLKEEMEVE